MATMNNAGTNGNATTAAQPMDTARAVLAGELVGGIALARKELDGREAVTVVHLAMESPDIPPQAEPVPAGRRAHEIATLTDLAAYMATRKCEATVGFYSRERVDVIINENSRSEFETVECSLDKHPSFSRWLGICEKPITQETLLKFLRLNRQSIGSGPLDQMTADFVTGAYASLKGELVHEADEFLDRKSRSATFTVRRRSGNATKDIELQDIPTEFPILVKLLQDDDKPTPLKVLVDMKGGPGAQVVFTLSIESIDEILDDHVMERLSGFSTMAGFLCVAGKMDVQPWTEARLPIAVDRLMQLQAAQMAASNGQQFPLVRRPASEV